MTQTELLSRIPAPDWEATPVSVRNLLLALLPLKEEVSALRARLHSFKQPEQSRSYGSDPRGQAEQVERYQQLVDQFFLIGLNEQETQELERLGTQMDEDAAPFYDAALQRMAAAATCGGTGTTGDWLCEPLSR